MLTQWFLLRLTWLPPSYVLVVAIHPLGRSRANCQSKAKPSVGLHIHSKDGDPPSHEQSTRVALRDPRWVSTVPLTISSLEHHTISLRASMESQTTKPSRRWQPPRVTSTTGLLHEHLVLLDAISQCNRTTIARSHNRIITIKHIWVRGFTSTP